MREDKRIFKGFNEDYVYKGKKGGKIEFTIQTNTERRTKCLMIILIGEELLKMIKCSQ